MAKDPITQCYDKVAEVLKSFDINVFSWNEFNTNPPKPVAASDLPEQQLRPINIAVLLGKSSCATEVVVDFHVVINTGDLRVGEKLFPEQWKLIKAAYALQYGEALNSLSFVERVAMSGATNGILDNTGRNTVGWGALWTIKVYMQFSSEDLT